MHTSAQKLTGQQGSNANEEPKLANPDLSLSGKVVYTTAPSIPAKSLYDFYGRSHKVFDSLQQIYLYDVAQQAGIRDGVFQPPGPELVKHMRTVASMYIDDVAGLKSSEDLSVSDLLSD